MCCGAVEAQVGWVLPAAPCCRIDNTKNKKLNTDATISFDIDWGRYVQLT
jgi:hypothetical protein